MHKVLYLVTRNTNLSQDPLFSPQVESDLQQEIVLLEEAVRISLDGQLNSIPVSALKEDLHQRKVAFTGRTIGYEDLVEKIFASDSVITL
ncbi:MAG: hypothetical protein NW703_10275 [Nitrospiraceae bacterium]